MRLLWLPFLLLFVACQSAQKKDENPQKKRVEAFAKSIQDNVNNTRTVALDLHFDRATFVNRVVNDKRWDAHLDDLKNRTYKPNYKQQLMQNMSLANMFLSGINPQQFFSYDFIQVYKIDHNWHAVFRLYANQALNYHDMLLRVDSNKVFIEDVYITSVGQQLSQVMKEAYVAGMPAQDGGRAAENSRLLVKTKQYMQRQNYAAALATFDSLAAPFKEQKNMRLFRLQIEANLPSENYIREIERYEKDYPNDAGTLLLQLDKNFMSGNYPDMLLGLNRLEKMYGPDPVVDFMRGNALNLSGRCDSAAVHYKIALAAKPTWADALNNWVDCLLKAKKYAQAIALIEKHAEAQQITPSYMRYHFRKFPEFLTSEEFKAWAKK